jgi:hypothetical protein
LTILDSPPLGAEDILSWRWDMLSLLCIAKRLVLLMNRPNIVKTRDLYEGRDGPQIAHSQEGRGMRRSSK